MTKQSKYYGLITFDRELNHYEFTFGSFDKSDVTFERQDMNDKGYRLRDMQVITFNSCPSQSEIDRLMLELNNVK